MKRLNYRYGSEELPVLEDGLIGTMSGKRGSGKSSVAEPILSSALCGEEISGWHFHYAEGEKPGDSPVILLDTELPESLKERSEQRIFNNLQGILTQKQISKRYKHINLVEHVTYEEKREELYSIMEYPFSFMVIDNLSGLCGPLDNDSATELFQKCNAKAKEYGAIILAINHLKGDGSKSRGWVGSRFEDWGSTVLKLERFTDYGLTLISSDKCRLGNLPTIDFSIDKEGRVTESIVMPFPIT